MGAARLEIFSSRKNHKGGLQRIIRREFDEACLAPVTPPQAEDIKAVRDKQRASQAVLPRSV